MFAFRLCLSAALACAAWPVAGQGLSLEEAFRLGESYSARLAAQRSAVVATGAQVGRAAELPDPRVQFGIENLPVTGTDRFRYDRDFMTSRAIGFSQEFPNAAKREARNVRAERMRDLETAGLQAQRTLVHRDIAKAWMEVYYAEQALAAVQRLAGQFKLQLDAIPSSIARGRQSAAEGLALRQLFEQANDRVIEQERLVARARIGLAALVGEEAKRALAQPPDTSAFAHSREHFVAQLSEHPEIQMLERREDVAKAEVELARSSRKSDWMVEVGYGQRRPFFDNMLTVMVSFDLPWATERRQDRDVASRLAEVDQARAMREDARRMHVAELQGWLADFDAAQRRIDRFEKVLAPLARERRGAALAAYEGGRGELAAVLEAQRAETDTELARLQAFGERARAWANLNFVYLRGDTR